MIHAARALGLKVMLGCMIESELGIAQAAQLGSLVDYIDLDGHLLISSRPFAGLGLRGRAARAVRAPGPGRGAGRWLTGSRCSPAASSPISHAKTAHGILRYGEREVVASSTPSQRRHDAPTRSCPTRAGRCRSWRRSPRRRELGANVLVIGVAPFGGALTDEWRVALLEAIDARDERRGGPAHACSPRTPSCAPRPRPPGVELRDLRAAPPGLSVAAARPRRTRRVVHTVGSDCAIGKMSVTLELDAAARARGMQSAFVATGQTGIAISGWGIAVDHVISDFVAGAASQLVARGRRARRRCCSSRARARWAIPAYSGVTLGLLHGCQPDVAGALPPGRARPTSTTTRASPIPPLPELIETVRGRDGVGGQPARVGAIALNTRGLRRRRRARGARARERGDGLPAADPGALRG